MDKTMERKDVLKSPDYWTTKIQTALYRCAHEFMKATGKNRSQLAEHLGVSKGYVTQLLNGDYDHKLSKLTELSLAFGYIPVLNFVSVEEYLEEGKTEGTAFNHIIIPPIDVRKLVEKDLVASVTENP